MSKSDSRAIDALPLAITPPKEQQQDRAEPAEERTLEGMAWAIFQSWFVDFDPVRAKAAGASRAWLVKWRLEGRASSQAEARRLDIARHRGMISTRKDFDHLTLDNISVVVYTN